MGLPELSSELKQHPRHKLRMPTLICEVLPYINPPIVILVGYAIGVVGFISASAPWTL